MCVSANSTTASSSVPSVQKLRIDCSESSRGLIWRLQSQAVKIALVKIILLRVVVVGVCGSGSAGPSDGAAEASFGQGLYR